VAIDPLHRVTIDDVATRAGVHKATVSRALNTRTRHQVNGKTAARITAVAEELGYVPNAMARGLRTSNSMTVGVIIPDLTNPFFPPIIRGIENYLQPRGYTALLANTDDSEVIEQAALDSLLGRRVDGLVVASGSLQTSTLAAAHKAGVFVVMLNRDAGGIPYPLVTGNDARGIAAAVTHLAELGHRRIMHIAGPADFSTSGTRADAFLSACRATRGVTGTVIEAAALSVEAGTQTMDGVLTKSRARPTAIVAGNDLVALGVLRSLRSHGLSCPDDVSVVGFNDIEFAQDSNPPLTTVHVPMLEMGTEAARMLLEAIESRSQEPLTVHLPVSLIVRGSTGPAPS
jgi:LacI family transcriptional regulator